MPDFFLTAKLFGLVFEPVNAIFLLLVCATILLWLGRWRAARTVLTVLTGALTAIVLLPIGTLLVAPLEQRFPAPAGLPEHVDGIVVLGGAQEPSITRAYGQAALNARAERLTTFLALARRYPGARLVSSGGSGELGGPRYTEAETTRLFLEEQGFDANRVLFEQTSRNTYENALFSSQLVHPRLGETWLLITSAADMPRAIGVFRKVGWRVVPVPCDYTVVQADWSPNLSLAAELRLLSHAVHEWLGLVAYRLTGKTDRLFPAPQ